MTARPPGTAVCGVLATYAFDFPRGLILASIAFPVGEHGSVIQALGKAYPAGHPDFERVGPPVAVLPFDAPRHPLGEDDAAVLAALRFANERLQRGDLRMGPELLAELGRLGTLAGGPLPTPPGPSPGPPYAYDARARPIHSGHP